MLLCAFQRTLVVVSQQVILGQPRHRCVAFDAEVGAMIVVIVRKGVRLSVLFAEDS